MKIFQDILNFVFPKKCSWCWNYWENLCKNCLENFSERSEKFFNLEKNFSEDKKVFEKIYSPFFYQKNPVLKKILKDIKYKNKFSKFSGLEEKIFFEFEKFLEEIFIATNKDVPAEHLYEVKNKNIFLIPTPLHWKKFLKRWFNQSEIFCDFLEKKFNKKNIKKLNLIKKMKNTKPQAEYSRNERLENLEWVFKVRKKIFWNKFNFWSEACLSDSEFCSEKVEIISKDKSVFIIIDDILSTWSTMKNCWTEIKKHFPESKVFWFTICSDRK